MRAVVAALLLATAWLAEPSVVVALSVQEAILRAKPAVALITAEIQADVTMNCGQGLVTVSPAPFVETGTGWFVDGRGFLVTNREPYKACGETLAARRRPGSFLPAS